MSDSAAYQVLIESCAKSTFIPEIIDCCRLDRILQDIAERIDYNRDTVDVLGTLPAMEKKEIYNKYSCTGQECPRISPADFMLTNYEKSQFTSTHKLSNSARTEFKIRVDTDIDNPIIDEQFLHLKFDLPKIDPSFSLNSLVGVGVPDEANIRYQYCATPGIRLLHHYGLQISQETVETVQWEQVLEYHKQMVPDNLRKIWHELIGQDNGIICFSDARDLEVRQKYRFYDGYQTFKAQQEALVLNIPLMMAVNKFSYNTSLMNDSFVYIAGEFERSDLIVRAIYDDGVNDPQPIPLAPLTIACARVISNKSRFSDNMNALLIGMPNKRLVTQYLVDRYKLRDLDCGLEIKGDGVLEALSFYVTPAGYTKDFVLWDKTEEVEERCVSVPVMSFDGMGQPGQVSVEPAVYYKSASRVKNVALLYKDIELKKKNCSLIYQTLAKYNIAKQIRHFDPMATNGIFMMSFNKFLYTDQINGVLNLSALRYPTLEIEFDDDIVDKINNCLYEDYEVTVIRRHFNVMMTIGNNITQVWNNK